MRIQNVTLNVTALSIVSQNSECCYGWRRYAECLIFIVILNAFMLRGIMLNVSFYILMLNAFLNGVAFC